MIIRMYDGIITFGAAQNFDSTVSNHFVGIHIDGGTGTTLYSITNELIVEFAFQNFTAGLPNGITDIFIQFTNFMVSDSTSNFDLC